MEETAERVGVSRKRAAELARYAESHVAAPGAPSQTQAVRSLAERCEVDQKTARAFLDGLSSLAIAEVKKNGVFVLKGLGRLMRVIRNLVQAAIGLLVKLSGFRQEKL